MSFFESRPEKCDDCLKRVGSVADPSSNYYGDAYCTRHKMACKQWFTMNGGDCDDYIPMVGAKRVKEPKHKPTKASLDGFGLDVAPAQDKGAEE